MDDDPDGEVYLAVVDGVLQWVREENHGSVEEVSGQLESPDELP